jgi:hypothetical protein
MLEALVQVKQAATHGLTTSPNIKTIELTAPKKLNAPSRDSYDSCTPMRKSNTVELE